MLILTHFYYKLTTILKQYILELFLYVRNIKSKTGYWLQTKHYKQCCRQSECWSFINQECEYMCQKTFCEYFLLILSGNTFCEYFVWILSVNTLCEYFLLIFYVNTSYGYFLWILSVNTLCEYVMWLYLWILSLNTFCEYFLWILSVNAYSRYSPSDPLHAALYITWWVLGLELINAI